MKWLQRKQYEGESATVAHDQRRIDYAFVIVFLDTFRATRSSYPLRRSLIELASPEFKYFRGPRKGTCTLVPFATYVYRIYMYVRHEHFDAWNHIMESLLQGTLYIENTPYASFRVSSQQRNRHHRVRVCFCVCRKPQQHE